MKITKSQLKELVRQSIYSVVESSSESGRPTKMKESIKVLQECAELKAKKSEDYQNEDSNVIQAMHYRRGVDSLHDIIQGKCYRAQSLLESGSDPNHESLEDTYKDIINYCSFVVSYMRGKMEGQRSDRDMFNKPKVKKN